MAKRKKTPDIIINNDDMEFFEKAKKYQESIIQNSKAVQKEQEPHDEVFDNDLSVFADSEGDSDNLSILMSHGLVEIPNDSLEVFEKKTVTEINNIYYLYVKGHRNEIDRLERDFSKKRIPVLMKKEEIKYGTIVSEIDDTYYDKINQIIEKYPVLMVTGVYEDRHRGHGIIFFSRSGYPYVTDSEYSFDLDTSNDYRNEYIPDFFDETHEITYPQTGEDGVFNYLYPFIDLWNEERFIYTIEGKVYELNLEKLAEYSAKITGAPMLKSNLYIRVEDSCDWEKLYDIEFDHNFDLSVKLASEVFPATDGPKEFYWDRIEVRKVSFLELIRKIINILPGKCAILGCIKIAESDWRSGYDILYYFGKELKQFHKKFDLCNPIFINRFNHPLDWI